ncbi:hypothetical protein [Marinobacter halodurans]|uniref:hypothetical protein n=1 Tax=Marinobacter halodurans TaxID=2528979 RepID=UPI0013F15B10|nr:hypothetical protein [Marinobacter halodurans]
MNSKRFMPSDRQLNGLIISLVFSTTYLLAAIAGTWWLDGDLLRGAMAIEVDPEIWTGA